MKNEIIEKLKEIEISESNTEEIKEVPYINHKKFDSPDKILTFQGTALYVNLRGPIKLVYAHREKIISKIFISYYSIISFIAKENYGEIRNFNGKSVYIFFPGIQSDSASKAVTAAMQIKNALLKIANDFLDKYTDINFGIGIEYGEISALQTGTDSHGYKIIWMGDAVDKAKSICSECGDNYNIGISDFVHNNINDNIKYEEQSSLFGGKSEVDIWKKYNMEYDNKSEYCYRTKKDMTIE